MALDRIAIADLIMRTVEEYTLAQGCTCLDEPSTCWYRLNDSERATQVGLAVIFALEMADYEIVKEGDGT